MNLSRPFILRPVATTLLMVAILLSGVLSYRLLPISALPQVDYPTLQVLTFYPGASSQVMASSVTAPLERQLGQMPGLIQMSSSSSSGCSLIILQFDLSYGLDVAEQEVQAAINAAATLLPQDLPAPPIYSKVNPADPPVLTLALTSNRVPLTEVEDLADTRLAQKISQLSGVGLVKITGGQRPAIRVQANPVRLAAQGLTLEDVRTAIAAGNVNLAKGSFDGPHQSAVIGANDQLLRSADYRRLIVAYRNGAPVTLDAVANVADGAENVRLAAWFNDRPAVILQVQRQPGANVIQVVDRIKELLPRLKAALPASVEVHLLTDRTTSIRASVKDVQLELSLSVLLVVLVIIVFLRTFSATVIAAVAVPLSLVGTLGVMLLLDFSLNNLTLMALTIATGFVVDDAIVMIENVSRYTEAGEPPLQAALRGAQQIGFTILSLTVSLVAVLIPLLFMADVAGRLFRQFAVTLGITILVSAVVSLTLTPMMCARLVRHRPAEARGRFDRGAERVLNRVIAAYGRTLRWVLGHSTLTLLVFGVTLAVTVALYIIVPKGFFPVQDTGALLGVTRASQTISVPAMAERQRAACRVILADPAVESLSSFIGIDGTNVTLNSGRILINLKPPGVRRASAAEVGERLSRTLAKVSGIDVVLQPVEDLTVDVRVSRAKYQYALEDADGAELARLAPRVVDALRERPELREVASDQQDRGLGLHLDINRITAARLGIDTQTLNDTLYDAYGQRQISTLFTEVNQYRVILEVQRPFRQGPEGLGSLYLKGAASPDSAGTVPLAAVTRASEVASPLSVERQGQFPVVTVSFNLAPGVPLGEAIRVVDETVHSLGLPASVSHDFQGTARAFQAALSREAWLILAALVVVYLVLGVLYESYIHPLTILSTLPSAGVGALLALLACRMELTVVAIIGIVLLIGIVKKNAIMMIDFALDAERLEGKRPREAIYEACLLRFRPILMTTFAGLLGALPLALGIGVGAELRRPLGVSIVGGLIVSQILTLYTTPVVYLTLSRWSRRPPTPGTGGTGADTPGATRGAPP